MRVIYFVLGCWVGGLVGFFTAAIMAMAHQAPEPVVDVGRERHPHA